MYTTCPAERRAPTLPSRRNHNCWTSRLIHCLLPWVKKALLAIDQCTLRWQVAYQASVGFENTRNSPSGQFRLQSSICCGWKGPQRRQSQFILLRLAIVGQLPKTRYVHRFIQTLIQRANTMLLSVCCKRKICLHLCFDKNQIGIAFSEAFFLLLCDWSVLSQIPIKFIGLHSMWSNSDRNKHQKYVRYA